MFSLSDYDYHLPEELVAQKPVALRDRSNLLFLRRETGEASHHAFYELYDLLSPDDLIVINNTEVIPGRLFGYKDTGGKAEVLLLNYAEGREKMKNGGELVSQCLIKASKRPKPGSSICFDQDLIAEVIGFRNGVHTVKFSFTGDFESHLCRIGRIPLPPYIKRSANNGDCDDTVAYQTVYASQKGAVAAPTAGLHFSEKLLDALKLKGIKIVAITLHVGYGTFLPVRVSDIRDHKMYAEWFSIPEETAVEINHAGKNGGRVVAVGTTSVRTLEYASDENGNVASGSGSCDLFIYPGYRFKVVDAMVTNFHLPKSTLLMLVSAFAGRKKILDAYSGAIDKRYRFYSYGDAMFIA